MNIVHFNIILIYEIEKYSNIASLRLKCSIKSNWILHIDVQPENWTLHDKIITCDNRLKEWNKYSLEWRSLRGHHMIEGYNLFDRLNDFYVYLYAKNFEPLICQEADSYPLD